VIWECGVRLYVHAHALTKVDPPMAQRKWKHGRMQRDCPQPCTSPTRASTAPNNFTPTTFLQLTLLPELLAESVIMLAYRLPALEFVQGNLP